MLENYESLEVQELFRRFPSDQDREWAWHAIKETLKKTS